MKESVYSRISRNKGFLMAFAVLWMVMFHTDFTFSGKAVYLPFQYLFKFVGYGSVDIFMFLSGFGLFCSLSRNADVISFYKKRCIRLLPSYFLLMAVWIPLMAVVRGISLPEIAGNLFCTGWWMGLDHQFNWYAQMIWAFYLLTPLFFAFLSEGAHKGLRGAVLLLLAFLAALPFYQKEPFKALARMPLYILGMLFGQAYLNKKSMSIPLQVGLICASALGILIPGVVNRLLGQEILWRLWLWWYPFFLVTPGLCIVLSYVADGLRRCFAKPLVTGMEKIGACTFEIYLIQIAVYDFTSNAYEKTTGTLLLIMLVTVALGMLFKKTVDFGYKRLISHS